MAYFKVRIDRASNTAKEIVVATDKAQTAIRLTAIGLRDEGITDAIGINVVGRVKSLRD
jgi:hypothetical protein